MKADVLVFPNMASRGPLGGRGIVNFTLKFEDFWIFPKIYQKFKSKLAIPWPPNGPLHNILGKSNTSAFTGKKISLSFFKQILDQNEFLPKNQLHLNKIP